MDISDLIESKYRLFSETEVIKVPKRIYKRKDLQRLSNRWYGFKSVARKYTLSYEPLIDSVDFVITDSKPLYVMESYTSSVVSRYYTIHLELPKVRWVHTFPLEQRIWLEEIRERFTYEAKAMLYDKLSKELEAQINKQHWSLD